MYSHIQRYMVVLISCFFPSVVFAEEEVEAVTVVPVEDVQWGYLNPLRGDKSPGAAELWGDRKKSIPTGMLVRFKPGFSSPPHIHNITYRGVVIEGMVHNDDPNAEKMWMPTGSFWTQPAGEKHITAASGESNLIFLEIDSGPYLVKPPNAQFDNGERPINIHVSNLVWISGNSLESVKGNGIEIATLWGSTKSGEAGGELVKLPANFNGKIDVDAGEFRAVVIKGSLTYTSADQQVRTLLPGSYIGSTGKREHSFFTSQESWLYIRTDDAYLIAPH